MGVTVKATCNNGGCGEHVELPAEAVSLVFVNLNRRTSEWVAAEYRFVCPKCSNPVERSADRDVVALLRGAHVTEVVSVDCRTLERRPARARQPVVPDDLLDFHIELETFPYPPLDAPWEDHPDAWWLPC